jgi:integrase
LVTAHYDDFQDFRDWYRLHRRRQAGRTASEHTLRSKSVHLVKAARTLDCTGEEFLANQLRDPLMAGRLLRTYEDEMTPGAARVAVYALLSFAEYATARGWYDSVEDCAVTRQDVPARNPKPPITVYSEEEMEAFVSAARGVDVRWWALITFLVDTGRRIGETLDIEWEWLRLDADPAYVEFPFTKNGEPQYVPLTQRLRRQVFTPENIAWMKEHDKAGANSFRRTVDKHPFPWGYTTAQGRFERFCERTGLPNRGFHCFRHTVITERLARGVPLQAVSRLAGHSSVAVTDDRYNHASALSYSRFVERQV